ncbi:MAG: ABC transporter permease subunit [Acidobacteriota bacterium]|nr:MAG: ABC transporter permease subunit [Acidobacteriota bacterium]
MKRADAVWAIAKKELSERLQNRWIWTVSFLVLAATLAIAFLSAAPVGVVGAHGGGAILASILNLAVYLVPLLALVMGAGAIIDEKRRGLLDLVLTYPVSSGEYFLGTFVGYALALGIALVTSFVPTGIVLSATTGVDALQYTLLLVLVLGLGTSFLALSFLISILSRDPARGVASSVLVWILAVFVFDLVLVGILVGFGGQIPGSAFGAMLLLNPTDVFRLIAFTWVGSAASPLGLATVSPPFPAAVLVSVFVLWAVVPLWLSHRLFQKRLAMDKLI